MNPIFSDENYQYVYDSVVNYLRLLGKEDQINYNSNDFRDLLVNFEKILCADDEDMYVAYVRDLKGKLTIKIANRELSQTLYYLPCCIVEKTRGKFKKMLIAFFSLLEKNQKMISFIDSSDFEYLKDEYDFGVESGEFEEEDSDISTCIKGDGYKLLELISCKSEYSLEDVCDYFLKFKPKSRIEERLKPMLIRGLELITSGKIIMHYFDQDCDVYNDYEVDTCNVVRIVYKVDHLCDWLVESFNNACDGASCIYITKGEKILSPDTIDVLTRDPFPDDFLNWYEELIDEINELCLIP